MLPASECPVSEVAPSTQIQGEEKYTTTWWASGLATLPRSHMGWAIAAVSLETQPTTRGVKVKCPAHGRCPTSVSSRPFP